MKKDLIIIGASGHGKVCADIALKMNQWNQIYFLDDNESINQCMGFKVLGKVEEFKKHLDTSDFFVGIGHNQIRKRIFEELRKQNASVVTLIHPNAVLGINVEIGIGSAVMAGVVINSDTKIGKCCIANTSSSIDHDNQIGDFVHIAPGVHLSGTIKVGSNSWLGVGSVYKNNITICEDVVIGAGAVVIKDIEIKGTYVGVPVFKIN